MNNLSLVEQTMLGIYATTLDKTLKIRNVYSFYTFPVWVQMRLLEITSLLRKSEEIKAAWIVKNYPFKTNRPSMTARIKAKTVLLGGKNMKKTSLKQAADAIVCHLMQLKDSSYSETDMNCAIIIIKCAIVLQNEGKQDETIEEWIKDLTEGLKNKFGEQTQPDSDNEDGDNEQYTAAQEQPESNTSASSSAQQENQSDSTAKLEEKQSAGQKQKQNAQTHAKPNNRRPQSQRITSKHTDFSAEDLSSPELLEKVWQKLKQRSDREDIVAFWQNAEDYRSYAQKLNCELEFWEIFKNALLTSQQSKGTPFYQMFNALMAAHKKEHSFILRYAEQLRKEESARQQQTKQEKRKEETSNRQQAEQNNQAHQQSAESKWEFYSPDAHKVNAAAYYRIYGLTPETLTENNLKTARRRLLARWHPDVCNDPQAGERFKKVQTVYTFLHKELIYKQAKAKTA